MDDHTQELNRDELRRMRLHRLLADPEVQRVLDVSLALLVKDGAEGWDEDQAFEGACEKAWKRAHRFIDTVLELEQNQSEASSSDEK